MWNICKNTLFSCCVLWGICVLWDYRMDTCGVTKNLGQYPAINEIGRACKTIIREVMIMRSTSVMWHDLNLLHRQCRDVLQTDEIIPAKTTVSPGCDPRRRPLKKYVFLTEMSKFIQLYSVAFSNSTRPTRRHIYPHMHTWQSMPSNKRLKTGLIRPSLCQCWHDPVINAFLSFLNYYVIVVQKLQKTIALSILQLELQKWYLREQYDRAINVWWIEILYPQMHSLWDTTIWRKNYAIMKRARRCCELKGRNFAPLSSQTRDSVFEIWQFKVFIMYCQWGFCDP